MFLPEFSIFPYKMSPGIALILKNLKQNKKGTCLATADR